MSLVGAAASGKYHLILRMLKQGIFVPAFDKIFYFDQYSKAEMQKEIKNIEFIGKFGS